VLSAIFGFARRADTHSLPSNPVTGTTKRRERLQTRGDYTSLEDFVFCSRLGRRLDPSAVHRHFKAARDAGLRPLRFHAVRHTAGSLIDQHADARFVQEFLGYSRITTTERYMHAKARPEDLERVNLAFAANSMSK
jgi:site-specific recombinase XerD